VPVVVVVICAWIFAESWSAHPDYLAYFNALAGDRPEQILAESDLDWGQDFKRLSETLQRRGVEKVAIAYFGVQPRDTVKLPANEGASPYKKTSGYVAVSARLVTLDNAATGAFDWLKPYTPIERVGRSMLLYYVP
jgi:hypothetical protein